MKTVTEKAKLVAESTYWYLFEYRENPHGAIVGVVATFGERRGP